MLYVWSNIKFVTIFIYQLFKGQKQVWDALRLICQDDSDNLELVRSILDGCGVVLPCGQLTEIYDSYGFRYILPPYCICDPVFSEKVELKTARISNSDCGADRVKIRLSYGKDLNIDIKSQEKVSDLKSYIRMHENIDLKRRMVVLWHGKLLDDCIALQALNLPRDAVLQVMVP